MGRQVTIKLCPGHQHIVVFPIYATEPAHLDLLARAASPFDWKVEHRLPNQASISPHPIRHVQGWDERIHPPNEAHAAARMKDVVPMPTLVEALEIALQNAGFTTKKEGWK